MHSRKNDGWTSRLSCRSICGCGILPQPLSAVSSTAVQGSTAPPIIFAGFDQQGQETIPDKRVLESPRKGRPAERESQFVRGKNTTALLFRFICVGECCYLMVIFSLMNKHHKLPTKRVLVATLLWLVAGLLPTGCLFKEFGWELGFLFSRGYGELFVFPLLVSWLFPLLLSGLPSPGGRKVWLRYTIPSFLVAFVITCLDVWGENRALWEMKPEILKQESGLVEHYRNPPPMLPPPTAGEHPGLAAKREDAETKRKEFLGSILKRIPLVEPGNHGMMDLGKNSVTWWFYVINMSVITFSQLLLLGASITFLVSHGLGGILGLVNHQGVKKPDVAKLNRILGALGLCLIWFLFRCVHNHHTEKVYPGASFPGADIMWICCWLICLGSWSICMMADFETAHKILGALGACVLGAATYFTAVFKGEDVLEALGPQGSPRSFAVLMIAVLFVGYLVWLTLKSTTEREPMVVDDDRLEGR